MERKKRDILNIFKEIPNLVGKITCFAAVILGSVLLIWFGNRDAYSYNGTEKNNFYKELKDNVNSLKVILEQNDKKFLELIVQIASLSKEDPKIPSGKALDTFYNSFNGGLKEIHSKTKRIDDLIDETNDYILLKEKTILANIFFQHALSLTLIISGIIGLFWFNLIESREKREKWELNERKEMRKSEMGKVNIESDRNKGIDEVILIAPMGHMVEGGEKSD